MTTTQKVIKYLAIAFACFLIVVIISGILNAFYSLSGILGIGADNSKMVITNFENTEIDVLDIKVAASQLIIKQGDSLKVETNNDNIKINKGNKKLQIKEKKRNWFSINKKQKLIVYLPQNLQLENVTINTGAGKVDIESLNSETLVFELGAGSSEIKQLNVTKNCEIQGGAGKISILSGNINNLNLDMGVGQTNLSVILTGNNEIDAGVGELNINLQNSKENYSIKPEKGLGNIKIDGKEISNGKVYGKGKNFIDVDGGVGNINISFN